MIRPLHDELGTTFQWQLDGVDIPGATTSSYMLQAGQGNGRKLRVAVTPKTDPILTHPNEGVKTWSTEVETLGLPPVAANISISGILLVGETITGHYQYQDDDDDDDKEDISSSGTEYHWYWAGMPDVEIVGADRKSYKLTLSDVGKSLRFGVKPKSRTGNPYIGSLALSTPTSTIKSAVINSMHVSNNNALADGVSKINIIASVTDGHGKALSGQLVSFSADNGAMINPTGTTGADGKVTMTLTSRREGDVKVTAKVHNSTKVVTATFASTAKITDMMVSSDNALANGTSQNSIVVTVKDIFNQPVANRMVYFTAPNASVNSSGKTDLNGIVNMAVTSRTPGGKKLQQLRMVAKCLLL